MILSIIIYHSARVVIFVPGRTAQYRGASERIDQSCRLILYYIFYILYYIIYYGAVRACRIAVVCVFYTHSLAVLPHPSVTVGQVLLYPMALLKSRTRVSRLPCLYNPYTLFHRTKR